MGVLYFYKENKENELILSDGTSGDAMIFALYAPGSDLWPELIIQNSPFAESCECLQAINNKSHNSINTSTLMDTTNIFDHSTNSINKIINIPREPKMRWKKYKNVHCKTKQIIIIYSMKIYIWNMFRKQNNKIKK